MVHEQQGNGLGREQVFSLFVDHPASHSFREQKDPGGHQDVKEYEE